MSDTRRTLIRIHAINRDKNSVSVCVPGWRTDEIVDIDLGVMPQNLREFLVAGVRLFCYVNISAESAEDLIFERIDHRLHYPPKEP